MGSGEFGSNGSVHWKIVHTADERADGGFVTGRDPDRDVSGGKNTSPDDFTLRIRFRTQEEGQRVLTEAAKRVDGKGQVEFPVLTTNDTPGRRQKPDQNLPWEIRVRW